MTTIYDRLQSASSQNASLLQTLAKTGYSISGYQQNQNYISTLKKEISSQEQSLKSLNRSVDKEYADHMKYRDSHMKRLAYKLGGKKEVFADQASKEEKEWLDAVAAQLSAKNGLERLNKELSQATRKGAELMDVLKVHHSAGLELDALYNSIFSGPTPNMPLEDAKENEVIAALREHDIVQGVFSNDVQARQVLGDAEKFLVRARQDCEEAKSCSTADAWGVGGNWVEMSEQSALSRFQQHVSQTEMLMGQAMKVQPAIQPLGDMQVARMNFMSDIVFDNIFSDIHMRDKIKMSLSQIQTAEGKLKQEIKKQDQRVKSATAEVEMAKEKLVQRRQELQDVRKEVFENLAGPPAEYTGREPEKGWVVVPPL